MSCRVASLSAASLVTNKEVFFIIKAMRSLSSNATILQVRQQGENNRTVTILTPEEGVIWATLYGGPKSKLRSLVNAFNRGEIFLYRDKTKGSCKITDFDVKSYHPSFSGSLFKSYAASFGAEIIMKTRCAGSPESAFYLYNGLLDGMEMSSEEQSRLGLVRFLWRYIGLLGVRPDTSSCCQCGRPLLSRKPGSSSLDFKAAYSEDDNGFVCGDCAAANGHRFSLSGEALSYLEAVSVLPPKDVRQIKITRQAMAELKDFCYWLIKSACGVKFLSLESGISIL